MPAFFITLDQTLTYLVNLNSAVCVVPSMNLTSSVPHLFAQALFVFQVYVY